MRWVHGYYIKQQDVLDMVIPKNCSWVVKKIIGVRDHLQNLQSGKEWLQKPNFMIHKLYNELRGESQTWPWAKILCQTVALPKCIFVTWLLLHGKLATCQYLQHIGIIIDANCSLCGAANETLDHLLFDCLVSRRVWSDVMTWSKIERQPVQWRLEKEFLRSQCTTNNKKQRLYKSVVVVLVYGLWVERNRRRMQGHRSTEESIGKQYKDLIGWCCTKDMKLKTWLTAT